MAMWNNIKGRNMLLLFQQFFWGGIWMLNKVFFMVTMKSNFVQAMAEVATFASDKANPIIVNSLTCLW
jgi:hypothetical protein